MERSTGTTRPAIFLDRDGVINRNLASYVRSWADFEFLPGALHSLARLARLAWPVVVISNQSAIGRGLVRDEVVRDIHARMERTICQAGGRIDGVFYCPHRPEDRCECRKPEPGLLLQAAAKLQIDLASSYLVGDAAGDIRAAQKAGCQPIMVRTGRGGSELAVLQREGIAGYRLVEDLAEAVDFILAQAAQSAGASPTAMAHGQP